MRKNDTRYWIIKVAFERLVQLLGRNAADKGMFALPEDLHAIMREVLKKPVEGKPRSVDVNLAKLAIEIGVFVNQFQTQPVCVFQ